MSCEQKTKKIARAYEKNSVLFQKNHEKTRFSSIFWTFKFRALISPPRISKTHRTKVVCNYKR
jgi:hypothetical protein